MSETPVSAQDTGVVVSGPREAARFPRAARVRAKAEFTRVFDSGVRRAEPALADMVVLRRGNRLSVTPVTAAEWRAVCRVGRRGPRG